MHSKHDPSTNTQWQIGRRKKEQEEAIEMVEQRKQCQCMMKLVNFQCCNGEI